MTDNILCDEGLKLYLSWSDILETKGKDKAAAKVISAAYREYIAHRKSCDQCQKWL